MAEPKDTVKTTHFKGFTNTQCEFFPCHKPHKEFNCLFCYCPLVQLKCPGPYVAFKDKNGIMRKDCSACTLPHHGYDKSWSFIQKWLEKPEAWDHT